MNEITFDDTLRYVGRLFLTGQHELARQEAVLMARIRQLEEELAAERRERISPATRP